MAINWNDFVAAIWRYKFTLVATFFAALGATILVYHTVDPIYGSETLLAVGQSLEGQSKDASRETGQELSSLAQIAMTESILQEAISKVGVERLFPASTTSTENEFVAVAKELASDLGIGALLRSAEDNVKLETERSLTDRNISQLRRSLTAKVEDKTDLLRITFRHSDPKIAAEFVSALSVALREKQSELMAQPDAVFFLEKQKERLDSEARRASDKLAAFNVQTSIYSLDDQRRLLLQRANEMSSGLAATRTSMAEREGQRQALTEQLKKLKPVTQSPFVSSLVDGLGASPDQSSVRRSNQGERSISGDPPLLLVKVYQDAMASLLKVNSDLSGLSSLEERQKAELDAIHKELDALSNAEADYLSLKRSVALASTTAETFGRRIFEERISTEIASAKLSSIRVVQPALETSSPVFPKLHVFLALGTLAGVFLSICAALIRDSIARMQSSSLSVDRSGSVATYSGIYSASTVWGEGSTLAEAYNRGSGHPRHSFHRARG